MAELTSEQFEERMESFAQMVKGGFDSVDEQFKKVDEQFKKVDEQFKKVDEQFKKVDEQFKEVRKDITTIKTTMVTKDYLDDKLADLRGDLVILMRKEDTKLKKLIEKLRARDILNDADVQEIAYMEPFAVLHA